MRITQYRSTVKLFLNHFQINYTKTDFILLQKILACYSQIPFENISKIIKFNQVDGEWDRLRFPEELFTNFLEHNLGGTCYALTFFLWCILDFCGFEKAWPLVMDMKWSKNAHSGLVLVYENIPYLVDPGYLLSNPIPLLEQSKIIHYDNYMGIDLEYDPYTETYSLFTFNHYEKRFRYSFHNHALTLDEFLLFWKDSFYQKSMSHICLTKIDPKTKGRIYIRNNFVRYYSPSSKENIKSTLENAAKDYFSIQPEIIEQVKSYIH